MQKISKKGLVSVMMPVYNGMPDIQASIKSLLLQTYSNWECIIVNDGSTDGTGQYIDSLSDTRFVIHHFEKNKGRPYARQKALDLAQGEYIAMLDADDLIHPDKLQIQVDLLEKYSEVYLVASGICSFGTNVDFIKIRCKGDNKIYPYSISEKFPVAHACSILRRDWAIQFKYNPELLLGQDVDYLRRYLDGKKYINLDRVLYYYSEFDSMTKKKIRGAYRLYIKKFLKAKEYRNSTEYLMKYIYATLVFPFMKIGTILKKRGIAPTALELDEYNKYCKKILDKKQDESTSIS